MFLTEKQMRIIDVYRKGVFRELTIRELANSIRGASYSWTFNVVRLLVKSGILKQHKKGASNICSINLDSPLAILQLSLLGELEAFGSKVPKSIIECIIDAIPTPYFTLMVAGSYAKGTQTKSSDVDVVVLIDDAIEAKRVLNPIRNKSELMVPDVHPYVFRKSEFLQMLLSKEENYGKEIYRHHLIFFGAENYYRILKEAIINGFRD